MRSHTLLIALVMTGLTSAMVSTEASAFVSPAPPPGFERGGDGKWRYRPPAPTKPGPGGLLPGGTINIPKPGGGSHGAPVGFKPSPGAIGRAVGGLLRRNPGTAAAIGLGGWLLDNCLKNRGGSWVISCGPDPEIDWGPWVEPFGRTQHGSADAACQQGLNHQAGTEHDLRVVADFYGIDPDKASDAGCCAPGGGCLFGVSRSRIIGDPEVIPDDEMDRMLETAPIPAIPPIPIEVAPIINPSPGPNPQPMPFRVPIGDPIPRVDPDTGEQKWVQPGVELQQLGTPADPLRLDSRPYEEPVAAPGGTKPPTTGNGTGTGTGTGTNTGTTTDTATPPGGGKPEPEQPDVCAKYPHILACQKFGELNDPPRMDEELVTLSYQPYGNASGGACPAPRQASFFGRPLTISYQPICDFATMIRPLVIAMAYLSAALIFIGAARRS